MAENAFSGGQRNPALDHIVERIVNQTNSAEGTTLPPQQAGELRVPIVSGLRVTKVVPYLGGAEVTLAWREPEIHQGQLSHFNIYTQGLFSDSRVQQGPATARRSPATLRLSTNQNTVAVFTVQTVLKSGLMSLIQVSPSVSCPLQQAALTPSDFLPGTIPVNALQNGTPGQLISWNTAGVITTFGPGLADSILVGTGANTPTFKTASALDLVLGNSNLNTPGAIPFVLTPGVLTEDATELFYDSVNKYLGIGTNSPDSKIHVFEPVLGTQIQILDTAGVMEQLVQNQVLTTDATPTVLQTIIIPVGTTVAVEITVVARRTGGSAGTTEDGARYKIWATYKNVAGTATLIGAVSQIEDEDQPAWDTYLVPSANTVLLSVLGAGNNNVTWNGTIRIYTA